MKLRRMSEATKIAPPQMAAVVRELLELPPVRAINFEYTQALEPRPTSNAITNADIA
jgi:hypothetical protein